MDIISLENKLKVMKKQIEDLKNTLNISSMEDTKKELEKKTLENDFWSDNLTSKKVLDGIKELKLVIDKYNNIKEIYENIFLMCNLIKTEEDSDLEKEVEKDMKKLEREIENLETETLLSEEYDKLNAIITIHAGAGGTESQDWVEMLQRMYFMWAENNNYKVDVYDIQQGDEAGIKSISFLVSGLYAYGYLKSEKGVHRLVRISPFDSNKRRHTSFAAADVMPEIDESIEIEINKEDLKIDTYRASGAGGQHVNKTDSAIRIKHIPTDIVITCQSERSQIQNKENAMKMLKSKLYQYELNKTEERLKEIQGNLSENGWGSQIRSYVFCPYTLVKDHRTNYEIGNIDSVINGNISPFILAYLKYINKNK